MQLQPSVDTLLYNRLSDQPDILYQFDGEYIQGN